MASDDDMHYTFSPLSNEDRELLLANGHKPGEMSPELEQEVLRDLREQTDTDFDSRYHTVIADEDDDT